MNLLLEKLKTPDVTGFTHSGKFHADDVFSTALLMYVNPEISIIRGNQIPEEFDGIVYDIGRGEFDHHQKDSRVRENGIAYAAFGLLWEALGTEILGEELAIRFDEEFVQPLDHNDNTGERNELATLIGNFNLSWDEEGNNDAAFFQAVSVAEMILENKFSRYRGNERADKQVEEYLELQKPEEEEAKILILPQFVPCQKRLSETDIAFVIFPSNRGGYCIQPQKKEYSMNYKCSFPDSWLGLEKEALQEETGLASAGFCHKGGFLMTVGELEDAVMACKLSKDAFVEENCVVVYTERSDEEYVNAVKQMIHQMPQMKGCNIKQISFPDFPEMEIDGAYAESSMEKMEWKQLQKSILKQILAKKPEAVFVEGNAFWSYAMIHLLRKKKVPVITRVIRDGKELLVRIPSGS